MAKRIHYYFDGTKVYRQHKDTGVKEEISTTNKQILDGDTYSSSSYSGLYGSDDYQLLMNFPDTIQISAIKFKASGTTAFDVWVSTDSTDGWNGTWTQVLDSNYTPAYAYQIFNPTVLNAKWLRVYPPNVGYIFCLHLFGEYQSPRFEFWNSAGSAELSAEYPLAMANAPNLQDYAGNAQFKLKNTDSSTHSYSLSILAVKYGGDAVIADHYKLSTDGGTTKLGTVTVTALAAGALSGVIDVYGDVVKAHNPADGYHYFVIDVTETA